MRRLARAMIFTLGSILVLGAPSHGEEEEQKIYECTEGGGTIRYQHDPCEVPRKRATALAGVPVPERQPGTSSHKSTAEPRSKSAGIPPPRGDAPPRVDPRIVERLRIEDEQELADPGEPRPADPRLGSPERTWQTFLAAMRGGDRALATACLTSSALVETGPLIGSLSLDHLRDAANELTRIEVRGDIGPFRAARAGWTSGRPKWIFFEQARNGDWKIAAM